MSANEDLVISGTRTDSISKRRDLSHSAFRNLGLNSVQTLRSGVIGERVTVITNDGDFGLFEWLPTEIKLKIWKYAFEAPRIVSTSCKYINGDSYGHYQVRLVDSGQKNPQLYVNRLTRQQAIQRLNCLSQCSNLSTVMQFGSAKSTSGHGQPKGAATPAFCLMFFPMIGLSQSLVITLSSRDVLVNWDNLHRLSILLVHCFCELRELIVIMERLDFTIPGVRDEITFMDLTPKSFPEDNVVTHHTQTILSLGKELVLSVIHGEWKPNHWYNLVCSMTRSIKFYFMRKQETVQKMPSLTKTNPAEDLYCGLQGFKTSIGMSTVDQGDDKGHQLVQVFRKWTVPSVRFLAATTYKQLEEIDRN
ncbi:uncharacterized protein EAF02_003587 [Botrytis sinoallii]|uniref:uncharacterized protein n=1 Tax=Botrytis sinoallii TaxID=1463999 RepID=UPI0019006292|nr:uncharacterized protein EAF02_003587 [Botrytis sinoallii]KAF7886940.1 hypothetical protein EAF02_003587 [Botrytis sinoallii]